MIVAKAHASNLRVSTHIESAADFHTALLAGVDEINHMPGFRYRDDVKPHQLSEFEITDSDAKRAAKQGDCSGYYAWWYCEGRSPWKRCSASRTLGRTESPESQRSQATSRETGAWLRQLSGRLGAGIRLYRFATRV